MSTSWRLDAEPSPKILVLPPGDVDLGEAEAAIELWEHYSRKALDETQRLVVQVMMAQSPGGKWAAATTGREMPRQNGKGDEIEVVELWGLVQRAEAILHTVHDAVLLASQTQQRMLGVLEGHADLRRLVKRKWQGTGQQMIEMRNGGVIWYRTRTGGGGRGVDDIDRLVVDEAQHAAEEHLAAVSPTLLANDNPQMNAQGTAGMSGVSSWWWRFRRRALSDKPGSFGYVGHTAEVVGLGDDGRVRQEPIDVEDRGLWRESNPALASGRGGGIDFLEEQFQILSPESFAREHLCVWDPPDEDEHRSTIVEMDAWQALEDVPSTHPKRIALAVAASSNRQWTYIGLAGDRDDGRVHLQVVKSARQTGWVLDELVRLKREHRPVDIAMAADDPAASLLPDIEKRKGLKVTTLQSREVARASGMFLDSVKEETISHAGGRLLSISVEAARTTHSGAFANPKDDGTDIAPLKAVTAALYALRSSKKRTGSTETRKAVVM